MSGASFTEGTETHEVEGIPVQVFNSAKTVVDCFRFRSKVGLSVATEALRDFVRSQEGSIQKLERYWDTCRVRSVMRPYVESLIR